MLDNIYTSRFFLFGDKKSDTIGSWVMGDEWWSRKYEYTWCANFVKKDDICLDSACGVVHPFKYFLADTCKEAHACDIDEDIAKVSYKNHIVRKLDVLNLKEYEDNYFDKVYNISTLEHLDGWENVDLCLQAAKRVLKPNGHFVATFDCRELDWADIILDLLGKYFEFFGNVDKKICSNILLGPRKTETVFRSIVRKAH